MPIQIELKYSPKIEIGLKSSEKKLCFLYRSLESEEIINIGSGWHEMMDIVFPENYDSIFMSNERPKPRRRQPKTSISCNNSPEQNIKFSSSLFTPQRNLIENTKISRNLFDSPKTPISGAKSNFRTMIGTSAKRKRPKQGLSSFESANYIITPLKSQEMIDFECINPTEKINQEFEFILNGGTAAEILKRLGSEHLLREGSVLNEIKGEIVWIYWENGEGMEVNSSILMVESKRFRDAWKGGICDLYTKHSKVFLSPRPHLRSSLQPPSSPPFSIFSLFYTLLTTFPPNLPYYQTLPSLQLASLCSALLDYYQAPRLAPLLQCSLFSTPASSGELLPMMPLLSKIGQIAKYWGLRLFRARIRAVELKECFLDWRGELESNDEVRNEIRQIVEEEMLKGHWNARKVEVCRENGLWDGMQEGRAWRGKSGGWIAVGKMVAKKWENIRRVEAIGVYEEGIGEIWDNMAVIVSKRDSFDEEAVPIRTFSNFDLAMQTTRSNVPEETGRAKDPFWIDTTKYTQIPTKTVADSSSFIQPVFETPHLYTTVISNFPNAGCSFISKLISFQQLSLRIIVQLDAESETLGCYFYRPSKGSTQPYISSFLKVEMESLDGEVSGIEYIFLPIPKGGRLAFGMSNVCKYTENPIRIKVWLRVEPVHSAVLGHLLTNFKNIVNQQGIDNSLSLDESIQFNPLGDGAQGNFGIFQAKDSRKKRAIKEGIFDLTKEKHSIYTVDPFDTYFILNDNNLNITYEGDILSFISTYLASNSSLAPLIPALLLTTPRLLHITLKDTLTCLLPAGEGCVSSSVLATSMFFRGRVLSYVLSYPFPVSFKSFGLRSASTTPSPLMRSLPESLFQFCIDSRVPKPGAGFEPLVFSQELIKNDPKNVDGSTKHRGGEEPSLEYLTLRNEISRLEKELRIARWESQGRPRRIKETLPRGTQGNAVFGECCLG